MGPQYMRVAAGACLLATGLFAGSGAVALAGPDSSTDTGSSSVGAGAPRAGKFGVDRPGRAVRTGVSRPTPSPASGDLSNYVGSTQGPSANAVANLPAAVRDISQAIASALPSSPARTGVPVVKPPSLSGALAPLMNGVENVATALIGPKVAEPLMNVANQFLDGVSQAGPAASTASTSLRNNKVLPTPVTLPVQPKQALQAPLPEPVVPGSSRIAATAVPALPAAPTTMATPGVMTPQLLSNRINVSAPKPAPVAPVAAPATPNWFSGVASQIFHGVREALRNVSMTELALAALPGVAGLVFFFATGVGLGRRQAKFGFALASSGAVRFAVRGPLGVVRNGSTVAVHSRKKARSAESAGAEDRPRRHLRLVDAA